jgi:Membrane transport protein/short chain dehydrogenase
VDDYWCACGIGAEIAKAVLASGDKLVATARDTRALAHLGSHEHVIAVSRDVTNEAHVRSGVREGLGRFGRIGMLVSNAGLGLLGAVLWRWHPSVISLIVWGVAHVADHHQRADPGCVCHSVGLAVIGNLVSSLVLLPLTLALLEAGKSGGGGHQGLIVVWHSVLGSIRQPLVIAPVLGVVVALSGWHLPVALHNSLTLLGSATSGVALFALGLLLTGETLKLSFSAVLNTVTKNPVQPLAIWLLALLLDMPGEYGRQLILLGALPTATITTMFALRYKVYTSESNATVLLSTVVSIVTLGAAIALTQ